MIPCRHAPMEYTQLYGFMLGILSLCDHTVIYQALLLYFTNEEMSSRRLYNLPKAHTASMWHRQVWNQDCLTLKTAFSNTPTQSRLCFACLYYQDENTWRKSQRQLLWEHAINQVFGTWQFWVTIFIWATHTSLSALWHSWHTNKISGNMDPTTSTELPFTWPKQGLLAFVISLMGFSLTLPPQEEPHPQTLVHLLLFFVVVFCETGFSV